VQGIADKHADGRLAFVLEGGYHLDSLAQGVHAVLETLAGGDVPELFESGVREVAEAAEFHHSAFSDEEE
jgi:acetoin utilization deacetylase AcuC-like enzyme